MRTVVYSGVLSGPDAYYAQVEHFGLVAESWRGNVTVETIVVGMYYYWWGSG